MAAARQGQAAPYTRTDKIPNPKEFSGETDKLRPFLAQLRLKASTLSDEQSRLRLAVSVLSGAALDQVMPYLKDDSVDLPDLAALITLLEQAFDNPNRIADANRKLLSLVQANNTPFSVHYAEFQRYAAEGSWDEQAKLVLLKSSLCPRLKQDMIVVDVEPAKFRDFVALCQRLDSKRRAYATDTTAPRPGISRPNPTPRSTVPAVATAPAVPTTASGTHPGPMDLSSNRRRISPEEKARRQSQGLCNYCGGAGHYARECPNRQQTQPPLRAAEGTLAATHSVPPPSSESGKA